jgi:hypothetical protein
MVLVYLNNGECVEVTPATGARRIDNRLVCYDERGREVASYRSPDVVAFTASPDVIATMEEEVCDDVTVVPTKPEEQREARS